MRMWYLKNGPDPVRWHSVAGYSITRKHENCTEIEAIHLFTKRKFAYEFIDRIDPKREWIQVCHVDL